MWVGLLSCWWERMGGFVAVESDEWNDKLVELADTYLVMKVDRFGNIGEKRLHWLLSIAPERQVATGHDISTSHRTLHRTPSRHQECSSFSRYVRNSMQLSRATSS